MKADNYRFVLFVYQYSILIHGHDVKGKTQGLLHQVCHFANLHFRPKGSPAR